MERHHLRNTTRRPGARIRAIVLLGLFFAVLAFTNPLFFGAVGAIREAHAEEKMWQATVGPPVKVVPCTNAIYANPAMGVCTDIGVAQRMQDRIENAIYFQLLSAAIYGFLDAATYMAQTIAYDTASWIAEGAPGSGPLYYQQGFGTYLSNTAKDALGEFVGTLSTDFTSQFGLNLCKPPNWQALNFQLALSIPDLMIPLKRPTPKCPWSVLTQNWETAASSLSNADALANIGATFQMGGNDLSYAISAHVPLLDAVAGKEQGAILDRLEGSGYKPVKDFVTGNIKTPSQTVKENFEQQLIRNPAEAQNIRTSAIVMNAFELGFVEIGKATISTFVNTLASKLLSKIMKGIFQPSTQGSGGGIDFTNPFAAPGQSTQPQQIFSEQFKDILTPKLSSSEEENVLAELQASCSGAGRTKWSCAIDATLALGLSQGGMTVREALDPQKGGFINPNAQLIPSSDIEQNRDPTCAATGDRFCIANLRKLRLARIIPIGWELAADSPANQQRCMGGQGCITIGEVVAKFDDCNYDTLHGGTARGELDAEHPWCHLIDPNWVLASFPTKCMVKGYGNTLLSGTADRLFECQDSVSCLRRDADGKCTGGYGYCLAEQPYWQFDAQSCKEQFTSCRMFKPRGSNAKPIGYLRSTLDYGNCNASNVGCMWYATTRNPSAGEDAWTAAYAEPLGKVYFDATMAACDAKNDGCTDLKTVVPGAHAVNMLQNGSFEVPDPNVSGELLGWRRFADRQITDGASYTALNDTAPVVTEGEASADGARALAPPAAPSIGQLVRLNPAHQYTVSFYARRGAAAPSNAGLTIHFYGVQAGDPNLQPSKNDNIFVNPNFFKSSGCSATGADVRGGTPGQANVAIPATIGTNWQRFQCSFVPPSGAVWGIVFPIAGVGSVPLIDAVKLEESEVATPFGEGLNPDLETVNMKIPPSELGCTGEDTDHPLCASYARVCRANEAGCQGYRLKREPGSPEVPAVLSPVDLCPAECVGYGEFRKQPSTFDYTHNPGMPLLDDPNDETVAYFVPDTARFCTAADVGCEQFTNLGIAGQGGDTIGAYSWLRSCRQPGDAAQTYYTWEGSEDTGYQLRTWSMARDLAAPAPQGPMIVEKPGPDGMLKSPADCNATSYTSAFDADCRQFYDPQGNVFYRYESQTVLSDPLCQQYRLDRSSSADCTLTGGSFNAQTNSCVYEALGSKSKTCSQAVAGCRGYVGTAGKSQALVYNEEFSDGASPANVWANSGAILTRSEESVLVGDSSLRVEPGATGYFAFVVPTEPGVLYELTFWARRAGPPQSLSVEAFYGVNPTAIGSHSISSEWGVYRIGPWVGAPGLSETEMIIDHLGNGVAFFDKIRVERVSDVTYVIKNSWQTPASCDRTPEGIPEPHAMLGCDAYTDRNGKEANIRQFSRLCREKSVGCAGFVNTENTDTPYESRWTKTGSGNTVEVTVKPGDHYEYYIPAKAKMCPESAKGCRAFGLPQFTQDRLALTTGQGEQPFKTVYLKDDPAKYDEGLCSQPELFCESFAYNAAGQAGTAYFRAPGDHACEWKEGVVLGQCNLPNATQLAGRTYDGWFKTGTDCPCYPDRLMTGSAFGLRYTGDAGYNAWLGADQTLYGGAPQTYQAWSATCPEPQAECTEFRDPNDTSDPLHPMGRPYFVINDSRLDRESCNGQVDPGSGCVLFRDVSDSRLLYSSAATEQAYRERAYRPVGPVDCVGQPDHPACAAAAALSVGAFCYDSNNQPVCQRPTAPGYDGFFQCLAGEAIAGRTFHPCNDTNIVVKVKPDRACSQWLACRTGETTYDDVDGTFKNICSDLALCNASGETGAEGVPFCTSYVNRSIASETIFQPYRVTDAATYARRIIGFGAVDYGGLTIPDHFQVMDTLLKPVGSFITTDPRVASALKKDYRLAVPVPISSSNTDLARSPTAAESAAIAQSPELVPYVCIFPQTGAYGLRTDAFGRLSTTGATCWLSVDQEKPPTIAGVATTIVSDNLVVPFLEKRFTQGEHPNLDSTLSRAFPNTQCKASPESSAPFGNAYVLEWDDSVNPPQPKFIVDGYANANFCEYGEDCECVYKRVGYKGPVKYYSPLSTDVVNAICLGGPREGLPCIADVSIQGSQPPQAGGGATGTQAVNYQAPHPNANRQCGSGTCTPMSEATLVRGMTGQCLQYDISRPRGGGTGQDECLLWNPNPILTGPGDQYHWQPTAGYQPPQSSGRYYCTSPVRKPRSQPFWAASWIPKDVPREGFSWGKVALSTNPMAGAAFTSYKSTADTASLLGSSNIPGAGVGCGDDMNCRSGVGFMPNSAGNFAGSIKALFYADWFTSDGTCVDFLFVGGCTGGEAGATLDGTTAQNTDQGDACESIDDEDQDFIYKTDAMRLVTTAQGTNRSYAEYAFLINPVDVAYASLGYKPTDPETVFDYSTEDSIANLEFSVPSGKIGCGYSEEWVDGAHVDDYDAGKDKWGGADARWHSGFLKYLQEGGGTLDRKAAQVVTEDGSPSGIPVKVDCVIHDSTRAPDDGQCYLKTWELDYRAEGQDKFLAFMPGIGRESLDRLSTHPVYGKCESSHPWFAIRAVFEDTSRSENETDPLTIRPEQLTGPFQLVGLWVSSCAPGSSARYIYMTMKMNSADVCRELAETISKDSHDSAAFTDRNSADSGYSLKNGFSWDTTNIPFGASLANGDAGKQPLYMSGVRQSEVNPMNPPTFTYPGQTYFQTTKYPTSNWGLLSNVFARIYRIYGYNAHGVSRDDYACTNRASPEFGQWCPDLSRVGATRTETVTQVQQRLSRQYCGYGGTCVRGSMNASNLFASKVCNSFSGVNRGLDCSADPDICHIAPMEDRDGVPTPIYSACELFQGYTAPSDGSRGSTIEARWEIIANGRSYRCQGANCPAGSNCTWDGTAGSTGETGCSRADAVKVGAFRCAAGSVRAPDQVKQTINNAETYASYCTKISDQSHECAALLPTQSNACSNGTCVRSPWAQCAQDSDCTFYARNWWPSGNANNRFQTATISYGGGVGAQSSSWGAYLGYFDKAFPSPHTAYPDSPCEVVDGVLRNCGWFYAQTFGQSVLNQDRGFRAVENKDAALAAFYPAVPYDVQYSTGNWASTDSSYSRFFPTWISPSVVAANGGSESILTYDSWDDFRLMRLQPGFNPLIFAINDANDAYSPNYVSFNVGHLDGGTDELQYPGPLTLTITDTPPYVSYVQNDNWVGSGFGREDIMFAHYGACESTALMYRNSVVANTVVAGTCRGGGRAGAACSNDRDCLPAGVTQAMQDASVDWCNPVTSGPNSTNPAQSYGIVTDATHGNADCWPNGSDANDSRHPRIETDTELDLNICTHPAGYWPRPNYCLDPNDEYCGLFGYDILPATLNASVSDAPPLPTDVTVGLYTPRFLNPASYGPNTTMNFRYVDFYNPQPPHTAAPDVRACQGQRCRVTGLDTISLDGSVGGMANGGFGNHVATLRFYAWASHEQMPIRRVIVDWGDGAISELPDAYMKNRKPFCGTTKECSLTPGLTCETDNDCPPGGGSCESYGNCSNNPNLRCSNDTQCGLGGEQGVCEKRTFFGNSQDACDERYLEFRHAYACPADVATTHVPPDCTLNAGRTAVAGRCSRSNERTCAAASSCGIGDACVEAMAPPNGCYDALNNRCLFTPRVMIIDNWGWCSGECRNYLNTSGALEDDRSTRAILHPNGGCYDASSLRSNANMRKFVGVAQGSAGLNECATAPASDANIRPWIVYPGSLQILPGEAL